MSEYVEPTEDEADAMRRCDLIMDRQHRYLLGVSKLALPAVWFMIFFALLGEDWVWTWAMWITLALMLVAAPGLNHFHPDIRAGMRAQKSWTARMEKADDDN